MAKQRWKPAVWRRGEKIAEGVRVENEKIDAFLAEIDAVCEKYGFDISHEDGHGAFEIVDRGYGTGTLDSAHDCTGRGK